MTKTKQTVRRTEKMFGLGTASVETRGGVRDPIFDNPQSSLKNQLGLAAD